jgi:TonB family protein
MRIGTFLSCVALVATPAAAAPPLQLQPSGPWVLDYGEDSCRLLRNFGEGKAQATIAFEKSSPRSAMSLLVLGSAVNVDDDARDLSGDFKPLERSAFKNGNAVKTVATHHDAILWQHVSFIDPALFPEVTERKDPNSQDEVSLLRKRDAIVQNVITRAGQVQAIAITPRHRGAFELLTGPMGEAMKMMDQCTRDELSFWGIDPKVDDKIAIPAMPIKMLSWFSGDDYPAAAARRGVESSLQFRVNVSPEGRVTNCRIITTVQAPEINDRICAIIRSRARFKPAELADGTKVPDYYGNTIVFRMAN